MSVQDSDLAHLSGGGHDTPGPVGLQLSAIDELDYLTGDRANTRSGYGPARASIVEPRPYGLLRLIGRTDGPPLAPAVGPGLHQGDVGQHRQRARLEIVALLVLECSSSSCNRLYRKLNGGY